MENACGAWGYTGNEREYSRPTFVCFVACTEAVDVVVAVDISGSVCSGPPTCDDLNTLVDFSKSLIFEFTSSVTDARVAVLTFHLTTDIRQGLTNDNILLNNSLSGLTVGTRTNTAEAISIAAGILTADRPDINKVLVIITDGEPSDVDAANAQADEAQANGINVIIVGVDASNTLYSTLQRLSSPPRV